MKIKGNGLTWWENTFKVYNKRVSQKPDPIVARIKKAEEDFESFRRIRRNKIRPTETKQGYIDKQNEYLLTLDKAKSLIKQNKFGKDFFLYNNTVCGESFEDLRLEKGNFIPFEEVTKIILNHLCSGKNAFLCKTTSEKKMLVTDVRQKMGILIHIYTNGPVQRSEYIKPLSTTSPEDGIYIKADEDGGTACFWAGEDMIIFVNNDSENMDMVLLA